MSTLTTPKLLPIYYMEAKSELIRVLRTPGQVIPTLAFPVMFYLFFGILFKMNTEGISTYLMATYGTFGVVGPALMSFGVGIAVERGQGWFDLKEASPMPASAYLVARLVVVGAFSLAVLACLFGLGAAFGNVTLEASQWLLLTVVLTLGSVPFCAIGLTLGLYLKSTSAPAVVNLIYLPLGFFSGLWVPIAFFPEYLQTFANLLPPYHLSQIALKVVDLDAGASLSFHLAVLGAYCCVFFTLAMMAYNKKDKG